MSTPIEDYAFLSNCRSAALVSRLGSIDWLCFPRFDSPAMFGRLLDDRAGHWSIAVDGCTSSTRRYAESSLVLESTFTADTGTCVLTDALAFAEGKRKHELGENSPALLLRHVACTQGEVTLRIELAARLEYGLVEPLLLQVDGGVLGRGGASLFVFSSSLPMRLDDNTASASVRIAEGESIAFSLQHALTTESTPAPYTHHQIVERLRETSKTWRSWSEIHQHYKGPWRDLVAHSGRVLQGLMFQPTGAIVAAPTTSLPEVSGGDRNWDYRYTWIRDASLTMEALWTAACPFESTRFFQYLANAASAQVSRSSELQIMFGIGGEHDLTERTLPHLAGWNNSRPVRIGNGAWTQRQLDVYGELLRSADVLSDQLGNMDTSTRTFLVAVADAAATVWQQLDQGIWEARSEPKHFVHSKLMCWVALDSAIRIAALLQAEHRVAAWRDEREKIRQAILEQGWSDHAQAFTQAFGSQELDASCLLLSIVGFLPGDHPRVLSTIDAIATRLTDDRGLVYRYRATDGLEGKEGTFLLCTFWLAQAQALAGRVGEATSTFERAIQFANDLTLLSEEVDPVTGGLLGNFPQAFSHVGLINAAYTISQALDREPQLFHSLLEIE